MEAKDKLSCVDRYYAGWLIERHREVTGVLFRFKEVYSMSGVVIGLSRSAENRGRFGFLNVTGYECLREEQQTLQETQ